MGMSTGRGDDELNSEINVTPMVDVMLVLLIIFMITAPMMNTGVDIELPQVTAKDIEDPAGKLILVIGLDRKISLGTEEKTGIPWADLETKLKGNERLKRESEIWISADAKLPYSVVVTAMAIIKNSGVQKVMMLTKPTDTINLKDLDQITPP